LIALLILVESSSLKVPPHKSKTSASTSNLVLTTYQLWSFVKDHF
jgi:hypothetical protein